MLFLEEYLKESIFTLLLPEMENFAQRFYETLLHGSIPVLIGNSKRLPFSVFIDWSKVVLEFPPHFLSELHQILQRIGISEIAELKRNGRFYLENYLYDSKVLVRSILTAYRNLLRLPAPGEQSFHAQVISSTYPDGFQPDKLEQKDVTVDLDEDLHYLWNENPGILLLFD
jgi:hypothetical protein